MGYSTRQTPWAQWLILLAMLLFTLYGAVAIRLSMQGGEYVVKQSHPPRSKPYAFPEGGRTLFPAYRLVAIYGTPDTPVLGMLGEQPADAAIARVKGLAAAYQPLITEHTYPAFEIITTVASSFPTAADSYSYPIDQTTLSDWVTAASKNNVYVVLDLQSGRDDFLTQAKRYQRFLQLPNVGLALDPEWRLKPTELPLQQIGSVDINEVNATAEWLAEFVKENKLPQKLFLLHEFSVNMLPNRDLLDTSHSELAYVIQMDGQGSQADKLRTWSEVITDAPANVYFGWKNFSTKDSPLRTPEDTMKLVPEPWYVSYQ